MCYARTICTVIAPNEPLRLYSHVLPCTTLYYNEQLGIATLGFIFASIAHVRHFMLQPETKFQAPFDDYLPLLWVGGAGLS